MDPKSIYKTILVLQIKNQYRNRSPKPEPYRSEEASNRIQIGISIQLILKCRYENVKQLVCILRIELERHFEIKETKCDTCSSLEKTHRYSLSAWITS